MDLSQAQNVTLHYANLAATGFDRIPGSAIILRYIRSSYQNDPIRSAIEALLLLFAVRYLLAPSYSTKQRDQGVRLTAEEIDDLVEDWQPEGLVGDMTKVEKRELQAREGVVIAG
jgi:serine palmitoyltransferase